MTKKTYTVLSKIPVVSTVVRKIVDPFVFLSVGFEEGIYDPILEYMKKNPNVLMTNKLAREIWSSQK